MCKFTTATALRKFFSPEQIKRNGTRHSSKAFDRYLQAQNEDAIEMARLSTQITARESASEGSGQILKFRKKEGSE